MLSEQRKLLGCTKTVASAWTQACRHGASCIRIPNCGSHKRMYYVPRSVIILSKGVCCLSASPVSVVLVSCLYKAVSVRVGPCKPVALNPSKANRLVFLQTCLSAQVSIHLIIYIHIIQYMYLEELNKTKNCNRVYSCTVSRFLEFPTLFWSL